MQLVVNKYGASLRVRDGQFYLRAGEEQQLIPMDKVKSIMLNRSCMVSGEAIAGAVEREIDVFFVERNGQPLARVWSPRYGSIATIRKRQLAFSRSAAAVAWVTETVAAKIDNQCALLLSLNPSDYTVEAWVEEATGRLRNYQDKIRALTGDSVEAIAGTLRGLEGNASRHYFQQINGQLPEAYRYDKRSQRPARDMFNCLLNYAYGMLYNSIERALIKAGIDPYVGILHRDEYNRPVLAYDVIERFRVWAEYPVVDLCRQQVVFPEFFDVEEGDYWLNEGGKRLLIQSVNDYLDEVVEIGRRARSRAYHIQLYAEELAQQFKQFEE